MIKNFIEKSWLLIVASLFFGVLLAGTNVLLDPRIKQNEIDKFNALAGSMIKGALDFESSDLIEITSAKGKPVKIDVKKGINENGECLGWAFVAEGSGFADKVKLVIGVDAKFETLKGFGVLLSNETPGFGDKINNAKHYFVKQFTGTPAKTLKLAKIGNWEIIENDTEIIAITGATITSDAVVSIFNTYIKQVKAQLTEKGLL
jgi:electron transport complex protein RnfG